LGFWFVCLLVCLFGRFLYLFFLFYGDSISPWGQGWPSTHWEAQAGLGLHGALMYQVLHFMECNIWNVSWWFFSIVLVFREVLSSTISNTLLTMVFLVSCCFMLCYIVLHLILSYPYIWCRELTIFIQAPPAYTYSIYLFIYLFWDRVSLCREDSPVWGTEYWDYKHASLHLSLFLK
jgi:hypothetical protein